MARAVIFDLDDTLVDSAVLRPLRDARNWPAVFNRLGETALFPGIMELVVELDRRAVPFAVVTTSISNYANSLMRHHGIGERLLVAYHDARPQKPHPAPIRLALSKLGVVAADAVGIGDAEKDHVAYRAAGVRPIGAGWSPVLHTGPWDAVARSPLDIIGFVT